MKKNLFIYLVGLALTFISLVQAQPQEQQTVQMPPITDQPNEEGWINDANVAAKLSQETGAPVLLFFTGSDWCGWCVRLQNEVLSKQEFKDWVKTKGIILLELDYPKRKPQSEALVNQNRALQQRFGVKGFPSIYIIKGKTHAQLGYVAGGASAWIKQAEAKITL